MSSHRPFCLSLFASAFLVAMILPARSPASQVTFGPEVHGFDYHEVAGGREMDSETGVLPGLRLAFRTALPRSWSFDAHFEGGFGDTRYDGQTWAGTPVTTRTGNTLVAVELTGAKTLTSPFSRLRFAPYVGVGTSVWFRSIGSREGYDERYFWVTLPFGFRVGGPLGRRVSLELDMSVQWNVGGNIALSFPYHDLGSTSGSLGMGVGFRAEAPLRFHADDSLSLGISPFFETVGIGAGGPILLKDSGGRRVGLAREPNSRSYHYGARFTVDWEI